MPIVSASEHDISRPAECYEFSEPDVADAEGPAPLLATLAYAAAALFGLAFWISLVWLLS